MSMFTTTESPCGNAQSNCKNRVSLCGIVIHRHCRGQLHMLALTALGLENPHHNPTTGTSKGWLMHKLYAFEENQLRPTNRQMHNNSLWSLRVFFINGYFCRTFTQCKIAEPQLENDQSCSLLTLPLKFVTLHRSHSQIVHSMMII